VYDDFLFDDLQELPPISRQPVPLSAREKRRLNDLTPVKEKKKAPSTDSEAYLDILPKDETWENIDVEMPAAADEPESETP